MTDEEIASSINAEISYEEIGDLQDQQEYENTTVKDAKKAVDLLQKFLESNKILELTHFLPLYVRENCAIAKRFCKMADFN